MNNKIIYEGKVIDNIDPRGLGMIRVEPTHRLAKFDKFASSFNAKTDKWVHLKDPFMFRPLLPNYFNIVPQIGENVLLLYADTDQQHINGFYIPMSMTDRSKPDSTSFEQKSIFQKRGLNAKKPADLIDEFGRPKNKKYDGSFPTKDEFGFTGRGNSDLRFTDKSVMLRAGHINQERTRKESKPIREDNPAIFQLSLFDNIPQKIQSGIKDVIEFQEKELNSLIEYEIIKNENETFNSYVFVYNISKSNNINTRTINEFSVPSSMTMVSYFSKENISTLDETASYIRRIIKTLIKHAKNGNYGEINLIKDNIRKNKGLTDLYPLYFRPTTSLIENNDFTIEEIENIKNTIVIAGAGEPRVGLGLFYSDKEADTPTIIRQTPEYEWGNVPNVNKVATLLTDMNLLLTYNNNTPTDVNAIDFTKLSNKEITNEQIGQILTEQTFSMIRGEKLYELIKAMYDFIVNHVHNPAEPGVTTPQIRKTLDEKFQNFQRNILSTKNRIN